MFFLVLSFSIPIVLEYKLNLSLGRWWWILRSLLVAGTLLCWSVAHVPCKVPFMDTWRFKDNNVWWLYPRFDPLKCWFHLHLYPVHLAAPVTRFFLGVFGCDTPTLKQASQTVMAWLGMAWHGSEAVPHLAERKTMWISLVCIHFFDLTISRLSLKPARTKPLASNTPNLALLKVLLPVG